MHTRITLLFSALTLAACSGGGSGSNTPTQPGPSTPTPVLTSVTINVPAQSLTVGQTLQLSATPRDQNGNAIAATVTWSSSAPTVASVNGTGLVTALTAGNATISAQASAGSATVSSTTQITVSPAVAVLTSVAVSASATSIVVGATAQLTASPRDQNGAAIQATVTWSSSATGVATVSGTGLVTGVAAGTATITAQATAGGVTVAGTQQITVTTPTPSPVLTSVTVSPAAASISVGDGLQLTASPKDQNGAAIAATVLWSSSAASVASVNASTGAVTGVAAGTATITATASAGAVTVTGTAQITVSAAPTPVLTSVTIAGASTVAVSATIPLSASPKDQFGNAIAAAVSWSSLATGIATVNAGTGVVTGVSAGTATIRATATAGGVTVTADKSITVTGGFPLSETVNASGLSFTPFQTDIAAGGSVTWNLGGAHDVTFDSPGSPSNIPVTGSDSRTFSVAGTYNYHCSIHGAGMNGRVVVH